MEQTGLAGSKVAFLAAEGADQVERALRDAGATPVRLAPDSLGEAKASDFCALVVAGGAASAGRAAASERTVAFVRDFLEADKPVAASGHGAQLLLAAGAVKGRTLAAAPELRGDIEGAGGEWVDREVVVDQKLVTGPADVAAFARRIVTDFADWLDDDLVDRSSEASFPASDPPPGPAAAGKPGA